MGGAAVNGEAVAPSRLGLDRAGSPARIDAWNDLRAARPREYCGRLGDRHREGRHRASRLYEARTQPAADLDLRRSGPVLAGAAVRPHLHRLRDPHRLSPAALIAVAERRF